MSNLEAPQQHQFIHSLARSHCSQFLPTNLICIHNHPLWTVKCEFRKEQTEDSINKMASSSRGASHPNDDDDDDAVECIGVKPPENLVIDLLSSDSSAKSSAPLIGQPSGQKKPSNLTNTQDSSVDLSSDEDSPGVDSTRQKHSSTANHGCIHHDDSLSSSSGLDIKTSSDSDTKPRAVAKHKKEAPSAKLDSDDTSECSDLDAKPRAATKPQKQAPTAKLDSDDTSEYYPLERSSDTISNCVYAIPVPRVDSRTATSSMM